MMGRGKSEQGQFFYDFNLDDVVLASLFRFLASP